LECGGLPPLLVPRQIVILALLQSGGRPPHSKVCPPLYTNDSQIVFRKYLRQFCNSRTLPKTLDKSQKSCEARDGKEADIKTWATKTLPTLKEHQALANQIAAKVGA